MEELNLPIYRGKSLKTNQYVEGYLKPCTDTGSDVFWIQTKEWKDYQVEPTTLSISFPDMIDNDYNNIFASLSKSGKGGDILKCYLGSNIENCTFREMTFKYQSPFRFTIGVYDINAYPVIHRIGIQE